MAAAKAAAKAKDPKATPAPTRRTGPEFLRNENHIVSVHLTDDELKQRGTEIGRLMVQRSQELVAFEEKRVAHKKALQTIDRRVGDLSRALSTGTELRGVECKVFVNEAITHVETVRTDTGEVINTRALEPEERQRRLFRAGEAQTIAGAHGEKPREPESVDDDEGDLGEGEE